MHYDIEKQAETVQYNSTKLTVRQKLEFRRVNLTEELNKIDIAIKALDNNPGSEELLDALAKVGI